SWRNALVVAQVAGAFVLLAGSLLFLLSVQHALKLDLGFESQNLAVSQITIDRKHLSPPQAEQFFHDLQARVPALPEAQSVCLAEGPLLDGARYLRRHKLSLTGADQTPFGDQELESFVISPNYFATIGVPLTSGREFIERDLDSSSRVVIINESLALPAFPGQNPARRQAPLLTGLNGDNGDPLEIIGVAKDSTHHKLGEEIEPVLYRPIKQYFGYRGNYTILYVRTRRDPAAILPSVASLIKSLNPEVSFSQYTL